MNDTDKIVAATLAGAKLSSEDRRTGARSCADYVAAYREMLVELQMIDPKKPSDPTAKIFDADAIQ